MTNPHPRAAFTAAQIQLDGRPMIRVVDQCNEMGGMSVTNDAEAVVEFCLALYGNHSIYYRDSDGRWDELKHDGTHFAGFSSISSELAQQLEHFVP